MKTSDSRLPPQENAARFRVLNHDAMQSGAPDPVRGSARELGFSFLVSAHETNAAKGLSFALWNGDPQIVECLDSIGH